MSKLLNNEQRVVALKRVAVREKPDPTPDSESPPPTRSFQHLMPVSTALEPTPDAPTPEPPAPPAAPPLNRVPLPTMSPEALRYARRWYSTVSLFILVGTLWGLAAIVRTDARSRASVIRPRPAPAVPAHIIVGPPAATEPPHVSTQPTARSPRPAEPAPSVRATRDPFASALAPDKHDTALSEAQHVYSLMESALRNAATAIPESPETSAAQRHRQGE